MCYVHHGAAEQNLRTGQHKNLRMKVISSLQLISRESRATRSWLFEIMKKIVKKKNGFFDRHFEYLLEVTSMMHVNIVFSVILVRDSPRICCG